MTETKKGLRIIRHMVPDPPLPQIIWDRDDWYMLNTRHLKWHGMTIEIELDKKELEDECSP